MSSLTITIIQSNLQWEDKAANLRMFEEKIKAITTKTEMVVLPEMFSTGFSMHPEALAEKMDGPAMQWMERVARENRIILTGSLIIEDNGKYFNRLIWMLPVGQYGHYDKRHLFTLGEENQHYTPGISRLIASVKGWKVNFQICYDLRFPVWASQQSLVPTIFRKRRVSNFDANNMPDRPEYDVLVYVANWPARRSHAWKTLLHARAIENQCYVIGVNRVGDDGNEIHYSGDSRIIGPLGEILYDKAEEEDIFTITINKDDLDGVRNEFPFWKDADHFIIMPDESAVPEQ